MQRGHVHPPHRVVGELKRRHFELSADRHERTFTGHPTTIQLLGLGLQWLVNRRVKHHDELTVHEDRVGHHDPVLEQAHEAFRQARLTGSGRTVEEDGVL